MKPLTRPMKLTLIDCARRGSRRIGHLYLAGQTRLIKQGLVARELFDPEIGELTDSGAAQANELIAEQEFAWRDPTDSRAPGAGASNPPSQKEITS